MIRPNIPRSTLAAMVVLLLLQAQVVLAEDWQPVTGAQALTDFISGKTLVWQEGKTTNRGVYRADGTGTLYAWGVEFDRAWEVKGDDQLCFKGEPEDQCFTLEANATDPSLYRSTDVATGAVVEIRETGDAGEAVLDSKKAGAVSAKGGPAAASASEMAKQLANPANPIMIVFNNFDYVTFDGDLPGASDKTMTQYFFQAIVPFKLESSSILFRPGISVVFDQDVPNAMGGYDNIGTDLGDLVFDLVNTGTTEKGTIWGYGAIGTMPTASDDNLGGDKWALGPEVVYGKVGGWGAAGFVLGHQWDIAGSGNRDINLTTMNYFYAFTLENGLAITGGPTITYNHEAASGEELTLPLGLGITKTVALGGRPWQFKVEYWYNVVRPDVFAPEHTIRIGISPVFATPWNKGR
jgi:hypothetical protein